MKKIKKGKKIASCTKRGITFSEMERENRHTYPVTTFNYHITGKDYDTKEEIPKRESSSEVLSHFHGRTKILFLQHTTIVHPRSLR
jgi:nucleoid-associated protein YejK